MPPIPWRQDPRRVRRDGIEERQFQLPRIARRLGGGFLRLRAGSRPARAFFKIIAAAPKDANPPPFVPADAVKFWRWRVDGQKDWAALQKMLGDISPAALDSLNSVIDMANASAQQKDPDFDLRKNLIGNLGDDFISYQKSRRGRPWRT